MLTSQSIDTILIWCIFSGKWRGDSRWHERWELGFRRVVWLVWRFKVFSWPSLNFVYTVLCRQLSVHSICLYQARVRVCLSLEGLAAPVKVRCRPRPRPTGRLSGLWSKDRPLPRQNEEERKRAMIHYEGNTVSCFSWLSAELLMAKNVWKMTFFWLIE